MKCFSENELANFRHPPLRCRPAAERRHLSNAQIAQLVEQLAFNQLVLGSSPSLRTSLYLKESNGDLPVKWLKMGTKVGTILMKIVFNQSIASMMSLSPLLDLSSTVCQSQLFVKNDCRDPRQRTHTPIFGGGRRKEADEDFESQRDGLHAKIGQLTVELDFMRKKSKQLGL